MALSRSFHADTLAALTSGEPLFPVLLYDATWHDGRVSVNSSLTDIDWNGETWLAASQFVNLSVPMEAAGSAGGAALVHVTSTLEALAAEFGTSVRGLPVVIWWGLVEAVGSATLIGDPIELFAGYWNQRKFGLEIGDETATHDMSILIGIGPSWRHRGTLRHSAADQAEAFPGDTAGRWLINMEKQIANPAQWPAR